MRSRASATQKAKRAVASASPASAHATTSPLTLLLALAMLGSLLATHRLQVARTPAPLPPARPADEFHVVFSTDCGKYQDWQSEVVYHSATLAGQPGRVTRIASGCTDAEAAKLRARHAEPDLAGRFLVHLTPHFSTDGDSGKDYKFYNKPYGLRHWLGAGKGHWLARADLGDDAVVALIDPDFIFLRPLTADPGQFYGLGDGWLKFDLGKICGAKSRCANVTSAEAWRYYYPELLAEMYAYSMAAADLGLPHLRLDHYMVSNVNAWIDGAATSSCDVTLPQRLWPGHDVPVFVHYCQGAGSRRRAGLVFGKRRLPRRLSSCAGERPRPSPAAFARDHGDLRAVPAVGPPGRDLRDRKRRAWMFCAATDALNAVVAKYGFLGRRTRSDGAPCD
ncbi:hypothetical protein JL722_13845 [Aureococcus anophagefferens]|nr:hypothetical protein JL722_13845 [Aureococcus anophagefferens]